MGVIAEIQVLPLGTKSPSVSEYVSEAVKVLKERNVPFKVTPMATVFEVERLDEICEIVEEIKERLQSMDVKRIVFMIRIDYRSDKELKMDMKIESVMKRI